MKIKLFVILALTMGYLSTKAADPITLEKIFITLTNLEAKFNELNKIKESEYKEFYTKLRVGIRQSLMNKKLDNFIFNKLQDGPALRTAKYILEIMLKQTTSSSPYTIITTYTTDQLKEVNSNFTWIYPGYKEIDVPFDNIVNQIILISRLVDYIVSNYRANENISILSIDAFDSIFYRFFSLALFNEQSAQLKPSNIKLNLSILSDKLNEDDYAKIKQSIDLMDYTINHYETILALLKAKTKFDVFLINSEMKFNKEPKKQVKVYNISDKNELKEISLINFDQEEIIALVKGNIPEEIQETIFSQYIKKLLNIDTGVPHVSLAGYKATAQTIPLVNYMVILLQTRNAGENRSQVFALDYPKSAIWDLSMNISPGADILQELILIFAPDIQIFRFDINAKKFIKYKNPAAKRFKRRQLS